MISEISIWIINGIISLRIRFFREREKKDKELVHSDRKRRNWLKWIVGQKWRVGQIISATHLFLAFLNTLIWPGHAIKVKNSMCKRRSWCRQQARANKWKSSVKKLINITLYILRLPKQTSDYCILI